MDFWRRESEPSVFITQIGLCVEGGGHDSQAKNTVDTRAS